MKEKTLNKTMKLYEELNILVIFINLYRLFKQISFQLSHYYLKLTEVIIPFCYIKDSLDDTWLITFKIVSYIRKGFFFLFYMYEVMSITNLAHKL